MTVSEALAACEMYAVGHPVARRVCREVATLMWKYFGRLPVPGSKGQVTFAAPANFVCIDMLCATRPSITMSLAGTAQDYAAVNLAHLMVPARPGCVRIRTSNEFHRFAVMRAFFRAAQIATGTTKTLKPRQVPLPSKKRRKKSKGSPVPPPTMGSEQAQTEPKAPPSPPPTLKALPKPPPLDPTLIFQKPDPFLAPVDDLDLDADPDVFNPAAGYVHNAISPPPPAVVPVVPASEDPNLKLQIARIAMLIGQKTAASLTEAAAMIRRIRPRVDGSPELRGGFHQLIAIWRLIRQELERKSPCIDFGLPSWDATELARPGMVVPSRAPQLGGRKDPLPPPTIANAWVDKHLGTEDGVREFSCFTILENEPDAPVQPLLRFRDVAVLGSRIAPLYREGRLIRPWDIDRPHDEALLHDYVLALTVVQGKGSWTSNLLRNWVPRLRPYVRGITDDDLLPAALRAVGFLEGRGLLFQWTPRTWRITPEGFEAFDQHIGPEWLRASV